MDPDAHLCYCFRISKRKIVNYVRRERPRHASRISECFGAGTGCGWCIPFLLRIHEQILRGETSTEEELDSDSYAAARDRYRAEVKAGTREKNSASMLRGYVAPPAASSRSKDDDEDFDVTSYFSRPSPTDPEPEDLT